MKKIAAPPLFMLFLLCWVTMSYGQVHRSGSFDPGVETDTVHIRESALLSDIHGQVLKENQEGKLVPIAGATRVRPGEWLLVRAGAWFVIGTTTFGPEHHADRQVRFVSGVSLPAGASPREGTALPAQRGIVQPVQADGNCVLIQTSRGVACSTR